MSNERSPLLLNIVLVAVIALGIYLGVMYLEEQKGSAADLKSAEGRQSAPSASADDGGSLPAVPKPSQQVLPDAPLFIKDDIRVLIDESPPMKEVLNGYGGFGLVIGKEEYTVTLNEDGSMKDVEAGLRQSIDFRIITNDDDFRKFILLVKRGNALGIVQRLNEMQFEPEGKRKELLDRINAVQGFTSRIYSG